VRVQFHFRGWPVRVVAMFSALSLGAVVGHWAWPRDARAQPASSLSTVYVPSGGMIFRTFDGHPIARLARDADGAVIELYDGYDQPVTRIGASALSFPLRPQACAPSVTPHKPAFTLDDDDPWEQPPN